MSEILKRELRTECIKVRCTATEKETVQNRAALYSAKSMSEFLLTLGLGGHSQEYSTARRKADGPLLSAEVYERLFTMIEALQSRPDADHAVVKEAIALIHEARKDIAIHRLRTSFERSILK